jgi:hypothetical protein
MASSNPRYDLEANQSKEEALQRIQNAAGLSISPELFEKVYLSPDRDYRSYLANSMPL